MKVPPQVERKGLPPLAVEGLERLWAAISKEEFDWLVEGVELVAHGYSKNVSAEHVVSIAILVGSSAMMKTHP